MKRNGTRIRSLAVVVLLCLGLSACGSGDTLVGSDAENHDQPSTLFVKTGALATDSWGYTGGAPTPIAAPAQAEIVLKERTLLQDPYHVVVAGISPTRVNFSSDVTTLSTAAQASAPPNLVAYVDLAVGFAATALPAFSVTVDAGATPAGQTVRIYNYSPITKTWTAMQSAVVSSSGKIAFQTGEFGLWGAFRQ